MPASPVVIPETITVHLGVPSASAQNLTVPFADYIKNVASSEIYPTWPEQAIRANIYAQVSYVLNRVFTEWYRAQGYDFDITNSTRYDQSFVPGRDIFENISDIVDDMFNDYLTRGAAIEPLFAQYCNGTTTVCPGGLSQWGTVPLAEQGMSAEEIVRYFYGDDVNFVRNAPIAPNLGGSWPGETLRLGDVSEEVRIIQNRLNRISANFPNIPKIYPVDGIFDADTERAVRAFQQQFNLTADGIVGRATWYRIAFVYNNVKRLSVNIFSEIDQKHHTRYIASEMKLCRFDINLSRQNIIQNYILNEGRFIVFLIIHGTDTAQRDNCHFAQRLRHIVSAFNKDRKLKTCTLRRQQMI